MTVGLLDQAERLYRQAIAADPRNSIAAVGLARVALERGDEAGALWHARRAIAIDPQNPAAQRLIDRLVEVITHRAGGVSNGVPSSGAEPGRESRAEGADAEPAADATERRPAPPKRPGLLRRLTRRG